MIKDRLYLAIDNGFEGAIVSLRNDKILHKYLMPILNSTKTKREYDFQEIARIFREVKRDYKDIFVVLEKAMIIPISGRNSVASTHLCFGMFQGILSALKIPYIIVHPKVWQKRIFQGLNRKDSKLASITYATRIFPDEDFKKTSRCKKLHDGLTDAVCMAKYGSLDN